MGYPKLSRDVAFAAAVEAVAGTPETLVWANHAIRLIGAAEPEPYYIAPNRRRDLITGGGGKLGLADPKGRAMRSRIRLVLAGAGSAYAYVSEANKTVPAAHPILRAGGYSLAVSGGAGVEQAKYSLADDPSTTITAYIEISNKKYIVCGAVVEGLTFSPAGVGGLVIAEGTLVGIFSAVSEQALEAATYATVAPMTWNGTGSCVLNSVSVTGNALSVALGTRAEPNVDANAADGLQFFKLVDRDPSATVSFRVPAVSTLDPHALHDAATSFALSAVCGVDQGQYKKCTINADACTIVSVRDVDNSSFRDYTLEMELNYHATNECSLTFN